MVVVYALIYTIGVLTAVMVAFMILLGLVFRICNNSQQYAIISVAQDALSFANGLYLSISNLGVTTGTVFYGFFVSDMGIYETVIGAFCIAVAALVVILIKQATMARKSTLA